MKKPRKPGGLIPVTKWRRIRDDWVSTHDTVRAIADRHGICADTIYGKASREAWPPRGSLAEDPATIARLLYADLTAELRDSLRSLRDPDPEAPATATQRAPLIRAHRRALIALLDARKPLPGSTTTTPIDFPALDLDAARTDILARLARMDTAAIP